MPDNSLEKDIPEVVAEEVDVHGGKPMSTTLKSF